VDEETPGETHVSSLDSATFSCHEHCRFYIITDIFNLVFVLFYYFALAVGSFIGFWVAKLLFLSKIFISLITSHRLVSPMTHQSMEISVVQFLPSTC